MASRYSVNYSQQVKTIYKNNNRKSNNIPAIFLVIITMIALGVFVQLALMQGKSQDIRSKAFTQSQEGVSIKALEFSRSGSVTVDPSGSYITFGP